MSEIFSAIVGCLQQNSQSLSGNICINGLRRSGLELERWSIQDKSEDASNVIAAPGLSNKQDGQSHV
jgi:hypothetical protein